MSCRMLLLLLGLILLFVCTSLSSVLAVVASSNASSAPQPSSERGNESSDCAPQDLQALLAFKEETKNFNLTGWVSNDARCCDWQGVSCKSTSPTSDTEINGSPASTLVRVVNLSLPTLGLRGPISAALGNLSSLTTLNLSHNFFHGTVPNQLASLSMLRELDLRCNNLSGDILFLQNLSHLISVNLSSNYFTGSLPTFSALAGLLELCTSNNSLTGDIRTEICLHSPSLKILDFSINNFTGELSGGLGNCSKLEVLDLGGNGLVGGIPKDLFLLGSLETLCLARNNFTGRLDDAVGNLTNLTTLSIGINEFNGMIPRSLSRCTKLKALSLNQNNFSGEIDVDFGTMQQLEMLDLDTNNFTGSIPPSIAYCSALKTLNLAKNQLNGEIPMEFSNLKNLSILSLSTNRLNGSLKALVNCTNLVSLIVSKNLFTEPLPDDLSGFSKLQVLAVGYAGLPGTIPESLRFCSKLQVLDLSWNKLHGPLPGWLGNFRHLFYVDLSNNSFSGSIPPQLFNLSTLMHLDNLTGLETVVSNLAIKRQEGSPDLQYTQVSAFPPSLYLSHNGLTGPIPSQVGNLKMLLNLDLSNNNLTGVIPESLANATDLETLDLSMNHLTGRIPQCLSELTFLAVFDVSNNNLDGPIPSGNQFSTFSNKSYEGNPHLCGFPVLVTCRMPGNFRPQNTSLVMNKGKGINRIAILVPVSVGFGLAAVFVSGLIWMLTRRSAVYQGNESSRDMNVPQSSLSEALGLSVEMFHRHEKLTVGDLFKATNNFDVANIIGCGGFGLVYRADLGDGSKLAIKKLTGDCGQMEREFRAEVDALQKAQHENLVSLQGYFQVGNDRLLIYSYMENGSLDYWLHERPDAGMRLDWPTRLKIAQGAARGLGYLHQICNPHIVHRDIKSSNILLDDKFEAHLADFGLARLMSTDTHVTTELVGTLGYIPPEYSQAFNATLRGDVYSFGVVLLELLSRKRPVDVCKPRGAGDLVHWVQQMKHEGKPEETFDSMLQTKGYEEQMLQVLDVACLCIKLDPFKRPTIKDIIFWLDEVGHKNQPIK